MRRTICADVHADQLRFVSVVKARKVIKVLISRSRKKKPTQCLALAALAVLMLGLTGCPLLIAGSLVGSLGYESLQVQKNRGHTRDAI